MTFSETEANTSPAAATRIKRTLAEQAKGPIENPVERVRRGRPTFASNQSSRAI